MRKFIYLVVVIFVFVGCSGEDAFENVEKENFIESQSKEFGGSSNPVGVGNTPYLIIYNSTLTEIEISYTRSYYMAKYSNEIYFGPQQMKVYFDTHREIWHKKQWKPSTGLESEINNDDDRLDFED